MIDILPRPAPDLDVVVPPRVAPADLYRFRCARPPDRREQRLLWTWAALVALRSDATLVPEGRSERVQGEALEALQQRTNSAFVPPICRINLTQPLLVYRFYGDLCLRATDLYTSFFTVMRMPGLGEFARTLLGLTGRNSASNLGAFCIEQGSRILVGGISNRAEWADQIWIERNDGVMLLDNLALYRLPG